MIDTKASANCPECVAGKHGNCDGTAWDVPTDQLAACPCRLHNHRPPAGPSRQDIDLVAALAKSIDDAKAARKDTFADGHVPVSSGARGATAAVADTIRRRLDADLEDALALAISDPGSRTPRRRGEESGESVARWGARAVMAVLADAAERHLAPVASGVAAAPLDVDAVEAWWAGYVVVGDEGRAVVRQLVARIRELEAGVGESIDVDHLERQRAWSLATFGPGPRTAGVLDHIRRELLEVEADPTDLGEWVDVVILALVGAWRAGHDPLWIIRGIRAKQARNEARTWPDWRTAPADQAIEHLAEGGA